MDYDSEHEQLAQALVQNIAIVFSPNSPHNIFVPMAIAPTISPNNFMTSDMPTDPQYQNVPPNQGYREK